MDGRSSREVQSRSTKDMFKMQQGRFAPRKISAPSRRTALQSLRSQSQKLLSSAPRRSSISSAPRRRRESFSLNLQRQITELNASRSASPALDDEDADQSSKRHSLLLITGYLRRETVDKHRKFTSLLLVDQLHRFHFVP